MFITHAAIKQGETIFALPKPSRHHNILWLMREYQWKYQSKPYGQGFLLENGEFVSREEGLKIAIESGQVDPNNPSKNNQYRDNIHPTQLFSEDLW